MEWLIVSTVAGFIVTLIAIVTPIIRLNSNITKLNITIENIIEKITNQQVNIKDIENKVENHEIRIDRLERK